MTHQVLPVPLGRPLNHIEHQMESPENKDLERYDGLLLLQTSRQQSVVASCVCYCLQGLGRWKGTWRIEELLGFDRWVKKSMKVSS